MKNWQELLFFKDQNPIEIVNQTVTSKDCSLILKTFPKLKAALNSEEKKSKGKKEKKDKKKKLQYAHNP